MRASKEFNYATSIISIHEYMLFREFKTRQEVIDL